MRVVSFAFVLMLMCGTAFASDNPRVFVTDSSSWEVSGGAGGTSDGFGGAAKGGARPQTAEIIKTFHERCPNAIINNRREKANYVVVLDHEGGKDAIRRDNKIAIFEESSGDAIFSRSTRSLGNAVKDGCAAMFRDWSRRSGAVSKTVPLELDNEGSATTSVGAKLRPANDGARVEFSSDPNGGEIFVNGKFVGSTPSKISLAPGEYRVEIRKRGYETWQRDVTITGGDVAILAELVNPK